MANLNKVLLMGNLTRDPQLSYLPSQTALVEFGLAVNRRYKKQDGTMADEPCFVDCRMFGKRAETINRYFKKGEPIFVEGRLQYDQWQMKDGTRKNHLRVFVENFEFIGRVGGEQNTRSGGFGGAPITDRQDVLANAGDDDDIPF